MRDARLGRWAPVAAVRRLSWADRWLLFQAAVVLHLLPVWLRLSSVARVRSTMARALPPRATVAARAQDTPRARAIAALVAAASRHVIGPSTCLHRSLALWWLLGRRGVAADLHFGVRRTASGIDGHAWVAVDGLILGDAPGTTVEYRPIECLPAQRDR
jgi:hypothetical protein